MKRRQQLSLNELQSPRATAIAQVKYWSCRKTVFVICLFITIAFVCAYGWTQQCGATQLTYGDKISNLPQNADGTTTVTYSAPDGSGVPTQAVAAFNAWNNIPGTGVNFVPAPAGTVGNVTIASNTTDECIDTTPSTGAITYGQAFAPDFVQNSDDAILAFEHEIGHLLGFGENPPNSPSDVMNQTTQCIPSDPGFSLNNEVAPTAADGAAAATCLKKEKGCPKAK
jgi:hypothetical protein